MITYCRRLVSIISNFSFSLFHPPVPTVHIIKGMFRMRRNKKLPKYTVKRYIFNDLFRYSADFAFGEFTFSFALKRRAKLPRRGVADGGSRPVRIFPELGPRKELSPETYRSTAEKTLSKQRRRLAGAVFAVRADNRPIFRKSGIFRRHFVPNTGPLSRFRGVPDGKFPFLKLAFVPLFHRKKRRFSTLFVPCLPERETYFLPCPFPDARFFFNTAGQNKQIMIPRFFFIFAQPLFRKPKPFGFRIEFYIGNGLLRTVKKTAKKFLRK